MLPSADDPAQRPAADGSGDVAGDQAVFAAGDDVARDGAAGDGQIDVAGDVGRTRIVQPAAAAVDRAVFAVLSGDGQRDVSGQVRNAAAGGGVAAEDHAAGTAAQVDVVQRAVDAAADFRPGSVDGIGSEHERRFVRRACAENRVREHGFRRSGDPAAAFVLHMHRAGEAVAVEQNAVQRDVGSAFDPVLEMPFVFIQAVDFAAAGQEEPVSGKFEVFEVGDHGARDGVMSEFPDDRLLPFDHVVGAGSCRIEGVRAVSFADADVGVVFPIVAFSVADISEFSGIGIFGVAAVRIVRIIQIEIAVVVVSAAVADVFIAALAGDLDRFVVFAAQNLFRMEDFAACREAAGDDRVPAAAAGDLHVAVEDGVALHVVREQAAADEIPDGSSGAELRCDHGCSRDIAADRAEPGADIGVDCHVVQVHQNPAGDFGRSAVDGEDPVRRRRAPGGEQGRNVLRSGFVDSDAVAAAVHRVEGAAAGERDRDVSFEQGIPDSSGVVDFLSVFIVDRIAVFIEALLQDLRGASSAADQPVGDVVAAGHGEVDVALVPDADAGAVDDFAGRLVVAGGVVEMQDDVADDFDIPAASGHRREGGSVEFQIHRRLRGVAGGNGDHLVKVRFRFAPSIIVHQFVLFG